MIWIQTIILLVYKLFLAGKDASSYLLKEKVDNQFTKNRIKRWHRDGVVLDLLFTAVLGWATGEYISVFVQSLLVRLAVYDLAFNKWANLDVDHLGSTAWVDKQFVKIFGQRGAIKKSIIFLLLLILFNIFYV